MATRPPTVRRRRLGVQLRKIREDRGLTLDEAAALVMMSKSALSRMENAQVVARAHEVDYILMAYGIEQDDDRRSALVGLAKAGRSRDWMKRHATMDLEPIVKDFVRLEQDSRAIRSYEPHLIPGLLQTPDYARAAMESVPRRPGTNVDESLAFRMARKDALTRSDPVQLDVVIGEAAIRQTLGGRAILRAQLLHVLECLAKPNVNLQVLPLCAVKNPGLDGGFTMLDVETGDFTAVVIDSLTRSICVEDEDEVEPYALAFQGLQALALSPSESHRLIERAAEEIHAPPEEA
ncbi:helix-turn-helix domain-containing protein [Actinomadura meyerae]|jgi:transcriptional regulator with XRE-family HTH domain|nr:helix-turn-helix transcriptional regulator [Actinomadura meyerae]